jgi:hypothetical protein
MSKIRALLATLVAALAFAIPSAASADVWSDAAYSNWYTANYICGHVHWGQGCLDGQTGWAVYDNGFHTYFISAYDETVGWGTRYHYCALNSTWRGYFNVETTDYHNAQYGC